MYSVETCDLKYVRQPPTELQCNPYESNSGLSLLCSVAFEESNISDFSITWFRRKTAAGSSSGVEELPASLSRVRIDTRVTTVAEGTTRFTRLSQSRLILNGLDENNDVGEYWCQVRLRNNETLLQEKSNMLILHDVAYYEIHHGSRCDGDNFVDQMDCLHVQQITLITDRNALTDFMRPTPFSEVSPTSDGMAKELEDSGKNLAALYAVIAVIAVFCIVIVTLTIIIVVLYRKKCGPVRFKTEGECMVL